MSKILIVEDDTLLSSILSKELRAAGFEPVRAFDGAQAIEKAGSILPSLILLDLLLPQKDGYEVLTAIRANTVTSNIPVIVLSNLSKADEIERAKKLGVVHFMVKANSMPQEVIAKIIEITRTA